MPIGVLIISLVASAWIAVATARAGRRAMLFQHDIRYADGLLREIELKGWHDLVAPGKQGAFKMKLRISQERARFTSRVSGDARAHLDGYLSDQEAVISSALFAYFRELRLAEEKGPVSLSTRMEINEGYSADVDEALARMVQAVRDWPFYDRRRQVLELIAESYVQAWPESFSNHQLAVDKQMLSLNPSVWPWQLFRRFGVWLREWGEAIRYRRTSHRLRAWWRRWLERVEARRQNRADAAAARAARRNAIELRRLHELAADHHRALGQRIPFELVPIPPRPTRMRRGSRR